MNDDRFESVLRSVYDDKVWAKSQKMEFVKRMRKLGKQIAGEVENSDACHLINHEAS